jgi:transcriptional regulator with XRE-family HTH domain
MANFQRTDFTIAVGKQINELRKARGLRTMEMGIQLGTTQITVQRHLRGDAMLTAAQLAAYSNLLGCPTDALIPEKGKNGEWVAREIEARPKGLEPLTF